MRLCVINLERSTDRREFMRRQLDPLGLDYEFVRAVDGRANEHLQFSNYDEESCLRAWRRPLTAGEVGCFASHYQLWLRSVQTNEPLVVMEDDVEVSASIKSAISEAKERHSFEYIRLAGTTVRKFVLLRDGRYGDFEMARFLVGPMGTLCYVLFPDGAARFLAGATKWTLPVDNYMDCFWEHGVPCVGLMPFPVRVSSVIESTILDGGPSPSSLLRGRVWRPKRFLARKYGDLRRILANIRYAAGGEVVSTGTNQGNRVA